MTPRWSRSTELNGGLPSHLDCSNFELLLAGSLLLLALLHITGVHTTPNDYSSLFCVPFRSITSTILYRAYEGQRYVVTHYIYIRSNTYPISGGVADVMCMREAVRICLSPVLNLAQCPGATQLDLITGLSPYN
jgi:hypothetical protein